MFSFIVKIVPKAESFTLLKSKLKELRDHTVTEIGCHLYLLHESMEESTQCIFIYESFHSQADFEFHAQQDYMKEIFNLFETQLEKPVEITHLTNL